MGGADMTNARDQAALLVTGVVCITAILLIAYAVGRMI